MLSFLLLDSKIFWYNPIFIPTPGGNTSGCALVPTASGRTAAPCAASPPLLKYQRRTPCKSKGCGFGTPGGNTSGCALVPTASGRTAAPCAASPPLLKYQRRTPCKSKGCGFGTPGGNTSGCALVPTASGRTAAPCAAGPPLLKYQTRAPALAGARVWYSRRESNPQRPLRRGLLYPFNYGSVSL